MLRTASKDAKKKVRFFPLYRPGIMTGPPPETPYSLRFRYGALVKVSCLRRATQMALLRLVSKAAPWNWLVPLLLLSRIVAGRANLAEDPLVSTRISSRESRPGTRPKSQPSQTSLIGAPSKTVV